MATSGDLDPATHGDFLMAMDSHTHRGRRVSSRRGRRCIKIQSGQLSACVAGDCYAVNDVLAS